ncbi:MAG: hypothetical protein U1E65_18540 [Myxococcota bacterium]
MRRSAHAAGVFGLAIVALSAADAEAKPIAPAVFCSINSSAPVCQGQQPACTYCHTAPPERNAFGMAVAAALSPALPRPLSDMQFADGLQAALTAVGDADSDGDGTKNADEITAGTLPADPASKPRADHCPPTVRNGAYDVCFYDRKFVFKKLNLDFCGKSPSFDDLQAFAALPQAEQDTALDDALSLCLRSENWIGKDGVVWRLAHRKIKPLQAIKSGAGAGIIPLADYDDDYNLFVYENTGDRDVRDLLRANYFVTRSDNPTNYVQSADLGSQSISTDRRAGMITTKWFLVSQVMFSPLPRTAAAQAYRSYLNFDIAKLEGMYPRPSEPIDYDNRGVTADACKNCHATLDPLTYPFRNYDGLKKNPFGSYVNNRIERYFSGISPNIVNTPEAGYVLGQPVNNLVEWGQVASDSDQFAAAVVEDYWKLLMGEKASGEDEFVNLWRKLKTDDQYHVEAMLHRLIRTEAYGVP